MIDIGDEIAIDGLQYKVLKLLGHGKGGYSYLSTADNRQYVLKQIHHEPCSYYNFGNKIEAELHDYQRLSQTGIRIPKMIAVDKEKEVIVKEYIEGPVLSELIKSHREVAAYIEQMKAMLPAIYGAGLNIDYYPTNFIVNKQDGLLYYIDYECNLYDPKWDFEHWGINYWNGQEAIN